MNEYAIKADDLEQMQDRMRGITALLAALEEQALHSCVAPETLGIVGDAASEVADALKAVQRAGDAA